MSELFKNVEAFFKDKFFGIFTAITLGIIANILTAFFASKNMGIFSWILFIIFFSILLLLIIIAYRQQHWVPGISIWRLNKKKRIKLFKKWQNLKATQRVPQNASAIHMKHQIERQNILSIDFSAVNKLFKFLNMNYACLHLPLSAEKYYKIRDSFNTISEKAYTEINALLKTNRAGELRKIFDMIYYDLSQNSNYDGTIYDIVIIPGARTVFRADKARDLKLAGLVKKIYLSGNFPAYAKETEEEYNYLSEAEAMAIYLHDKSEPSIQREDLIIDKIARNTEENARFTLSTLKRLKTEFNKELDILLMTSPYHVKRFFLYFQWIKLRYLEFAINKIGSYVTQTKYEKDNWYLTISGFKTYLSEYWKIHVGRIIGEF